MNETYLMQHISYHLHTIVRRFSCFGEMEEEFCARVGFHDHVLSENVWELFDDISPSYPVLTAVNKQFIYSLVPAVSSIFIVGPVKIQSPVYFKYQKTLPMPDQQWTDSVALCSFREFTSDILLMYNLYHETILEEKNLSLLNCVQPDMKENIQKHFSDLVFVNREEERTHNPYDQELREFSAIENGDLEQLEQSLKEDYPGQVGTMASTPIRQAKNIAIVVITLACRAAIRGGILPEISFSLSDSYIQKIEECHDIPTIFHLFHSAEFQYAQMVLEHKERNKGSAVKEKNPHITRCKDYIFSHLHKKISVQEIADSLGLNPNYLSELFRSCEKITIKDFIIHEKINLVKNLLTYSDYTYIEIANYLSFSSQSHMGKYFKKVTGMTLRQYRDAYGVKHD